MASNPSSVGRSAGGAAPGTEKPTPEHAAGAQPHVHGHPSPRDYVNIAVVLAIITAVEVLTYFFELPSWALWGGLTAMAIAKFAIVVGWYMHLKFDSRMFRRVFVAGIVLAVSVFGLVIGLFAITPGPGAA